MVGAPVLENVSVHQVTQELIVRFMIDVIITIVMVMVNVTILTVPVHVMMAGLAHNVKLMTSVELLIVVDTVNVLWVEVNVPDTPFHP